MSCVATTAPTLLPLLIPAAIVAFRAAPVVWRSVAAHAKRVAARAQEKAVAPVTASPEKTAPAMDALPALT